jgi:diketogulonate reductase-like aldo/keto reductase
MSSAPTFLYGTAWKEDRTAALTELALRTGFRAIDTANQRRHYFEAGVGEGLAVAYRAGIVTRAHLFLQTKFTYPRGQDHRLPYDPAAQPATQVAQSLASSLDHLGTDHVDSFVLHGPSSSLRLDRMPTPKFGNLCGSERDAGRTRLLGVSNVSLQHLEANGVRARGTSRPSSRTAAFARLGWDREVRLLLQA